MDLAGTRGGALQGSHRPQTVGLAAPDGPQWSFCAQAPVGRGCRHGGRSAGTEADLAELADSDSENIRANAHRMAAVLANNDLPDPTEVVRVIKGGVMLGWQNNTVEPGDVTDTTSTTSTTVPNTTSTVSPATTTPEVLTTVVGQPSQPTATVLRSTVERSTSAQASPGGQLAFTGTSGTTAALWVAALSIALGLVCRSPVDDPHAGAPRTEEHHHSGWGLGNVKVFRTVAVWSVHPAWDAQAGIRG